MLQKQFLASKMEELQKQRAVLTEQLSQLITQKSLETRVEEDLRLKYLIKQIKDKREQIEQEMLQLEAKSMADGKDVVDCGQRIQQARMQLIAYLKHKEVGNFFPLLNEKLNRMNEEGITDDDENVLQKIMELSDDNISVTDFVIFFKELNSDAKKNSNQPDYVRLAKQLARGEVILCLGQESSHLLGAPLPSTNEIKTHLSQKEFYRPLSELCEQKELTTNSSRADLIKEIRALFNASRNASPVAFYAFLAEITQPFIIISTAYDSLLEQYLQEKRKLFMVIHLNMEEKDEGKKCLLHYSNQKDVCCSPDKIPHDLLEKGYTVICRLRGGILSNDGQLLLSERDYFSFIQWFKQDRQFPDYIGSRLKDPLCSLWFMGHHPESWEERLIVKSLQELRYDRAPSLAVQENISSFARAFWQDSNVKEIYDISLAEFVKELKAAS